MRSSIIGLAMLALMAFAMPASATTPEKTWVCHGTASASNPFVLLHVPQTSAHLTKHVADGSDKLAELVDDHYVCGDEDLEPFTGALTFHLTAAACKPGEAGVPGFDVILETFEKGELTDEQVIFTFPSTCIAPVPGPAGPAGPAGPGGPAGPQGVPGVTTTVTVSRTEKPAACRSRRTLSLKLPPGYSGRVTALVSGRRQTVRVDSRRRVRISFRGVKCGLGSIVIRRHGLKPVVRIYTLGPDGNITSFNVPVK